MTDKDLESAAPTMANHDMNNKMCSAIEFALLPFEPKTLAMMLCDIEKNTPEEVLCTIDTSWSEDRAVEPLDLMKQYVWCWFWSIADKQFKAEKA